VYAAVAEHLRLSVKDASGAEVPVELVRTLDASPGCSPGMQDVLFFRPMAALRPASAYTVELTFPPGVVGNSPRIPSATFSTGEGTAAPAPIPEIRRWLFAQQSGDSRILQVFAEVSGERPVFLVARGNPATMVLGLGPLGGQEPSGVSMGKADCADVEFVGHTGETIVSERLCEPERCDRPGTFRGDTCGGNLGGDRWQSWQSRPRECAPGSGGCSLPGSPAGAPPASAVVSPLAALLCLLARRRRRGPDQRATSG
jgi:hypothetical protein